MILSKKKKLEGGFCIKKILMIAAAVVVIISGVVVGVLTFSKDDSIGKTVEVAKNVHTEVKHEKLEKIKIWRTYDVSELYIMDFYVAYPFPERVNDYELKIKLPASWKDNTEMGEFLGEDKNGFESICSKDIFSLYKVNEDFILDREVDNKRSEIARFKSLSKYTIEEGITDNGYQYVQYKAITYSEDTAYLLYMKISDELITRYLMFLRSDKPEYIDIIRNSVQYSGI